MVSGKRGVLRLWAGRAGVTVVALAMLGLSAEVAADTLLLSQADDAQPLLDGLQRTGEQLGDGLEQTASQLGDGLGETLENLAGGSAELLLRLNGRYVETVDGSEALEIAVAHRGLGRRVVILRPTAVSMTPAPALLLLHYANGTPEQMANLARASRLAAERGAWIILPEAVNGQWREDPNALDVVDDVGFLEAVVTVVTRDYPIDPARLSLAGMSKGGFMATRLACQGEVAFAGLALVAAGMRRQQDLQCPLARPLRVMLIHGTADLVVPYDGRLGLLSAHAHFDRWAVHNDCQPEAETAAALPQKVDDGTAVRERRNADCAAPAAVSLLTIEGGGHTWPGSLPRAGFTVGRTSGNLDASLALWDFLAGVRP